MRFEDPNFYNALLCHFAACVKPNDIIEWFWVKDVTDHTWEIRRLRQFKIIFVEQNRFWFEWRAHCSGVLPSPGTGSSRRQGTGKKGGSSPPTANKQGSRIEPLTEQEETEFLSFLQRSFPDGKPAGINELAAATQFSEVIERYEAVERLIASAERRRDRTLREIAFRREYLAEQLRKKSDEIIGQLDETPLAAE